MTDYADVIDHTFDTVMTTIRYTVDAPSPQQVDLIVMLAKIIEAASGVIKNNVARDLPHSAGLKRHLADSEVDPNIITAAYAADHIYEYVDVILGPWNRDTASWDADERETVVSVILSVSFELGKLQGELRGRAGCHCSDCLPF
ncbi:hypothetical protein [Pseudoglutamicibacter cumminsii]|uniref:hypothetical protein n=1 Tax=Pseudoglutamicibacter cumminsii TaxID=156979 RepID=UPI0019583A1C|nr:hypothetical protein [Pseudoglutamicibacter cumminsii]MBM7796865.1 hypothetical protein [Pseudoglutamicibacter cumminsii]